MTIELVVARLDGETWREMVARESRSAGLEEECLGLFDRDVANGAPEDTAAFDALYEWDVVQLIVR